MPVAIAAKVDALRIDVGSAARLADMLGVSRAQVTRWLRGSGIDPLNAEKVDLLELVWANLLRLYEREAALAWLFGLNPFLGDRRPIDLIRATCWSNCSGPRLSRTQDEITSAESSTRCGANWSRPSASLLPTVRRCS